MSTGVGVVDGVVAAVAILVQSVDGVGVEVGGVVGRDKSSPLGAVIPGVAVVQAGIVIVVVATIANRVGFCYGSIARDGAIAPGIVDILSNLSAAGVVNAHNIAQRIPMEIVGRSHTVNGVLHTDDGVAVIQEDNPLTLCAGALISSCGNFGNQPTGMIVIELLAGIEQLIHIDALQSAGARQIGIGLGHTLAVGIIAEAIGFQTFCPRTLRQSGKFTSGPGGSLAVVSGGTANRIVGNGSVSAVILPPPLLPVKKKPPRL